MKSFPTYDPATDTISLNGNAAAMLTLLMKAKFGDKFDAEVLFHDRVATLIRDLDGAAGNQPRPAECFRSEDLSEFSKRVFAESFRNGWWTMGPEGREQLLQDAAAPWVLDEQQIQAIIDGIDDLLFRSRQIVELANGQS